MTRLSSQMAPLSIAPHGTAAAAFLLVVGLASHSQAWEPFVSPNPNVEDGNQALEEGDHQGALEAYNRAARELPEEPGVQLNRGLALLASGEHGEARQAFLDASEPGAPEEIRADALYNAGLSFYNEGDVAANAEDHQTAQGHFRGAADAFRRALRARPGWREAAWNLELALRRLREEEQAQQEQEEQEQQDQDQQGDQDEENNQQEQGSDGEEQQNGEEGGDQEQQNNDQQQEQDSSEQENQQSQEGEDGNDQNEPDQPDDNEGDQDDPNRDDDRQSQDQQSPQGGGEGGQDQEQSPAGGQEIPDNVARVLDALQNSEENLERYRARARARRENRRPTKDW